MKGFIAIFIVALHLAIENFAVDNQLASHLYGVESLFIILI
jgi:hypothetical protein